MASNNGDTDLNESSLEGRVIFNLPCEKLMEAIRTASLNKCRLEEIEELFETVCSLYDRVAYENKRSALCLRELVCLLF